ncbi:MAG: hypothetical protein HRT67_05585 [Flavobacteriaceae bacterium]|nr:hypothetical protein [Flavobacteriaceae bacterium]
MTFTEEDFIKIDITIFSLKNGKTTSLKKIEFKECFRNLQYFVIQEIDEKIKWIE